LDKLIFILLLFTANFTHAAYVDAVRVSNDQTLTNTQLRASPVPVSGSVTVSGVATAANQSTANTLLSSIESNTSTSSLTLATDGSAANTYWTQIAGYDGANAQAIKTDASGELQIDVLSSTLPSGAATSALQSTIDTSINTLLKPASTLSAVTTLGSITSALPSGANSIGQVTANAGTNLNTSALNLESTQSAMSAKLPSSLGTKTAANSFSVTIASDDARRSVSAGTVPVVFASTPSVSTGTVPITGSVTITGTPSVSVGTVNTNATLSAETTKVIGTVNLSTGQTIIAASVSAGTETASNVSNSASNQTGIAANAARNGYSVINDSSTSCYYKHGSASSLTSFKYKLLAGGFYESETPIYAGIVTFICDSATGTSRFSEY